MPRVFQTFLITKFWKDFYCGITVFVSKMRYPRNLAQQIWQHQMYILKNHFVQHQFSCPWIKCRTNFSKTQHILVILWFLGGRHSKRLLDVWNTIVQNNVIKLFLYKAVNILTVNQQKMPAQSQLYIALPHKNKIILFHRLLDFSGFKFLEYLIKVKCVLSKDQNDKLGPWLHLSNLHCCFQYL